MPRTTTLTTDQLRSRLEGVEVLLREPCTPGDRANARRIIADTLRSIEPTDAVGPLLATPLLSLQGIRELDGATFCREVL